MAKKYATVANESRYVEREVSYEEGWNKEGFFTRYNKKRKNGKGGDSPSGFIADIFLGLLEIFLG